MCSLVQRPSFKSLYGTNKPSPKKIQAVKCFLKGNRDFAATAKVLGVAVTTAEVYTIDGYCSGAPLSFAKLSDKIKLSPADVEKVSDGIKRRGTSLRNIRDGLGNLFTYNQIRLVLAAIIQGEIF